METTIKINDEVRLNSSNQRMTVVDIQDDIAFCTWLRDGKQEHGQFPVATLVKIDPESTVPKSIPNPRSTNPRNPFRRD